MHRLTSAMVLGLILVLFSSHAAAAQALTPVELTRRAIDTLRAIATTDAHLQPRLDRAADALASSLADGDDDLFLDGWRIEPPPHGRKFFDHAREAVAILIETSKRGSTPPPSAPLIDNAIRDLLDASRLVATLSVDTATRFVALEFLRDAPVVAARAALQDAANQTNAFKAIDRYGFAWLRSQEFAWGLSIAAFAAAPDPFSPRVAPFTLTATVSVMALAKNGDEQARPILELVEILQDASGAVIRRLTTPLQVPDVTRTTTATITSVWDGQDDHGRAVGDGRYSWLAFARLRWSGGPGLWATAFPVTGAVALDATPPVINGSSVPPPNANLWHNQPVLVSFTATDQLSGVASVTAPIAVSQEGSGQVVTGTAVDAAGNTASTSVSVNLDRTPPSIAITTPGNGASVQDALVTIAGVALDPLSGTQSVSCNGAAATLTGSTFSCGVTLQHGENAIVVAATDRAGNDGAVTLRVAFVTDDSDRDGVSSSIEDGAPNGGDGNGDGVADSAQAHVVSLPNAADGRYITLAFAPGTTPALVAAVANPSPGDAPVDARFPLGFLDFRIGGVTPGGSTTMMMHLPAGVRLSAYYRYGRTPDNQTPHWYEFRYDGATGAELLANEIRLHFIDGGRGDDDLTANGEISDPGAPANGPCQVDGDVQISLAPGQSFECRLPVLGDRTHTWAITATAAGSPSVLPPGLAFVEDNGRWSIAGTVAADAYLITSRAAFVGRGEVLTLPFEDVAEMAFNVEIPISVWTQNTILRPHHLLDFLEDIPHDTMGALVAFFFFGFPAGIAPEALLAADANYHARAQNTPIDNAQRASEIIRRAASFDLVALQEVFADEDFEHISEDANGHFVLPGPAAEGVSIIPPELPTGSSGLAVLLRRGLSPVLRQIVDATQHEPVIFTDCHRLLDDCLANKGFSFDIVHLGLDPRHYIYVVNTHTQSENDEEDRRVRQLQFEQIKAFVDQHADLLHPVLIMGDMNVDSGNTGEWEDMLDALGISPANDLFGRLRPGVFTYDSDRNAYARGWFPWSQQRLDYMLVRQGTRYRLDAKSVTLADEGTWTSLCETSHWFHDPDPNLHDLRCYLSDHFGIHARLTLAEDLPLVTILQPLEGARLLQHAPAQLQAFAGNPLRPRWDLYPSVSWTSDVDGFIGSRGARIWLPRTAGPHTLTASAVDADGFANSASVTIVVTPDTDRDGIGDDDEVARGTDPQNPDSDGDGLSDGDEVLRYGSDPLNRDTDGDGLDDGAEVRAGSSPFAADSDRDGLTDATEVAEGTNPASQDSDGDHVWDGVEVILRSNPLSASSRPTAIPEGTLFTQTLGFLAIIDPVRQLVGHVGTPGGGLGFGLEFDDTRRLFLSTFNGLVVADPLTGAVTPIGPFRTATGEGVSVINLSFDRLGQQLFGVEEGPAPNFLATGQLVQIDRATGTVTRMGRSADPLYAIAFDDTGRLLATVARDGLDDRIVEIDPATGSVVRDIGAPGVEPIFGLAVDPAGVVLGTAIQSTGFDTQLLRIDTATGAGTALASFSQAVFDLALYSLTAVPLGPIEDFQNDAVPSLPGFASSLFVHTISAGQIRSGFSTAPFPYPSPPHALYLLPAHSDRVTFSLHPDESIDRARVYANSRFGPVQVEFVGAGDTRTLLQHGNIGWQRLEASSIDIGDHGNPLGIILEIRLSGGEGLVDNLEVHIRR